MWQAFDQALLQLLFGVQRGFEFRQELEFHMTMLCEGMRGMESRDCLQYTFLAALTLLNVELTSEENRFQPMSLKTSIWTDTFSNSVRHFEVKHRSASLSVQTKEGQ